MADTTTPRLGLTKPEVAASKDTWGGKLNTNFDILDGIATSVGTAPPSSPVNGQLWFDSDSGKTYIYYVDADSNQWVQIAPGSGVSEAPNDGQQYARQSLGWSVVTGGGGGSMTGAQILTALAPVDGAGSGLDADLLDGLSSAAFEPFITAGTTAQYRRGDKSWQTLDKAAVGLSNVANTAQVTAVSGTAPVVSSGGTTPAISMAAATTSVNGYLTSTDWNTFNNKVTGVNTTKITVGTSAPGSPATGDLWVDTN